MNVLAKWALLVLFVTLAVVVIRQITRAYRDAARVKSRRLALEEGRTPLFETDTGSRINVFERSDREFCRLSLYEELFVLVTPQWAGAIPFSDVRSVEQKTPLVGTTRVLIHHTNDQASSPIVLFSLPVAAVLERFRAAGCSVVTESAHRA